MDPGQHAALTASVVAWAGADDRVLAVVGVGSTSGRRRPPDRWSDHDLVIVTRDRPDASRLRSSTDWLPVGPEEALVFQEPDHGLTVIDDSGHLLELAIAAHDDLAWLAADVAAVLYDAGGMTAVVERALERNRAAPSPAGTERFHAFVKELVIGVNRAGRGELLSANQRIRGSALSLLLSLLADVAPPELSGWGDPHDPHRRLEDTQPELAGQLELGLRRPLLDVATLLVDVADDRLVGHHPDVDRPGLRPVRAALARAVA